MTQNVSFRYNEKKPSTYKYQKKTPANYPMKVRDPNHPPHHSLIHIVFRFALVYFIFNLPYIHTSDGQGAPRIIQFTPSWLIVSVWLEVRRHHYRYHTPFYFIFFRFEKCAEPS
ncbi:hypothetical protein B9Z19DRAFT_1089570 [Tuber borchii]|uniref:Uncharacterized protein n=1 Tax=Tuber borchii TaxID=42251 RepID=A0A2T6ZK21_TUBBO|nr:hypothetical protein B9Z19DRAFT_1089570 [Tuber borchii]